MKTFLLLCCLATAVSAVVLPVRVQTIKEAPGVAALTGALWTTDVQIGSNQKTFTLAIDTLGESVWVTSSACSEPYCIAKQTYDPLYSSTYYKPPGYTILDDHLGEVRGNLAEDNIIFGKIANKSTVVRTTFTTATELPIPIAYAPGVDGVLGLAGLRDKSFMDDAFNERAWAADVVTYWLENQWETKDNGTHGVLYYGNYDNLHCNYSYYVQNSDAKYYKYTSTSLYVGGKGTTLYSSYGINRQVILDSTSPYITVPSTIASTILVGLGLNANTPLPATVDCNVISTMRFEFGNVKSTEKVQGINLSIPQPDGSCKLAMTISQSSSSDGSNGHFEVGIPFFRGRCTYLDRTMGTIGFGFPGTRVPGGKKK